LLRTLCPASKWLVLMGTTCVHAPHRSLWLGASMSLTRWTDDRLDDLARQVQQNSDTLKYLGTVLGDLQILNARIDERLRETADDSHACLNGLKSLRDDLEQRSQAQAQERRADRKWLIATLLTTAGLIIAAVALFVG
jgi:septal ring factor EnvC (AmiA/AmiB activator)